MTIKAITISNVIRSQKMKLGGLINIRTPTPSSERRILPKRPQLPKNSSLYYRQYPIKRKHHKKLKPLCLFRAIHFFFNYHFNNQLFLGTRQPMKIFYAFQLIRRAYFLFNDLRSHVYPIENDCIIFLLYIERYSVSNSYSKDWLLR